MAAVADVLNRAFHHQQAGRFSEAEALYRRILDSDPNQADALHLLGMIYYERGLNDAAARLIARAVELRPDISMFHNNLGNVLLAQGRPAEALLCFEQAIRTNPENHEAFSNSGNAFQELRRPGDAVLFYRKALELCPDHPQILNNLGNAFRGVRQLDAALDCFDRLVAARPEYAPAHLNRGNVLQELQRPSEAEAAYRRAAELAPRMAEPFSNLAALYIAQRRFAEAEQAGESALQLGFRTPDLLCNLAVIRGDQKRWGESAMLCHEALAAKPDHAEAHNTLAVALDELGLPHEAAAHCERALAIRPDMAEAYYNLGNARQSCGSADSIEWYRRAIALKPDLAEAHWNLSLALLRLGRFDEGWPEYEWRWRRRGAAARHLPGAPWDGTSPAGKRILVYAEQGFGDNIQFVRYTKLLVEAGATVILECRAEIAPLLVDAPGVGEVVAVGEPLPAYDCHAALMSLPRLFGTKVDTIPGGTPYLRADAAHCERLGARIARESGFRVGLAWSGNEAFAGNRKRSLPLEQFRSLLQLPGASFFSLQKGEAWRAGAPSTLISLYPDIENLQGTAAAIANLDLVVTVDTMAAHLGGALGRPTWVLLSHVADWRWLENSDRTSWYQSVRLFRQTARDDWSEVLLQLESALSRQILLTESARRR
jgi:tetratricopeptide (TPR) repeat protein